MMTNNLQVFPSEESFSAAIKPPLALTLPGQGAAAIGANGAESAPAAFGAERLKASLIKRHSFRFPIPRQLSAHLCDVPLPILLTWLKVLLLRYTGRSDLLVTTVTGHASTADRPGTGASSTTGIPLDPRPATADPVEPTVMLAPVISHLQSDTTVESAIAAVTQAWNNAPVASQIDDWLELGLGSTTEAPLLQVLLLLHTPDNCLQHIEQHSPALRQLLSEQFSLALRIDHLEFSDRLERNDSPEVVSPQGLPTPAAPSYILGSLEYNGAQFTSDTIARMVGHLETLLPELTQFDQPLDRLNILPLAQREQLVQAWNQTAMAYDPDRRVSHLLAQQVAARPEALALVYCDAQGQEQALTYGQFNQRVNQLAHYLHHQGVQPNQRVGVCLKRSPEWIIAVYAIYHLGATYVPLDPDYPRDRIEFMLTDSQAVVLITQSAVADLLAAEGLQKVLLDRDQALIAAQPTDQPITPSVFTSILDPEDLAYILYTSGSTGKPKGVMIPHRALTNFILTMQQTPGIEAGDRMLGLTTFSFDMAGLELFGPLSVGATLVVIDRSIAIDGVQLGRVIEQQRITLMQATPTNWRLLIEAGWQGQGELRILCGGEGWSRALADQLLVRGAQLWNMYGPTETTVWSTCHRVLPDEAGVPVGKPVGNTQVYLLDAHQQPVPIGVAGEVYISGDGVAHGYLNRPEITQEKFLADPFRAQAGALIYRTGDLARYLPDGSIECLGRMDHQVKLRGFRIELGEIEAVLERAPNVQQSVVIAREDTPGDQRLVGYLTAAPGCDLDPVQMKAHLAQQLPDYMVPAALVVLPEFPLTPNGKVDRKQLPAPQREQMATSAVVQATTDLELALVALWQEVLGLSPIGIQDNFLELGGQSLLAGRLANRIQSELHQPITPATLFQYPTIQALAEVWDHLDERTLGPSVVVIQAGESSVPPLFCIHVLGEACGFYRPLVKHLGDRQPVYGLSAQMADKSQAPTNRVEDIAAFYIREMKTLQPQGPYQLAGVSFGGHVTYEMARQLKERGEEVSLLALFDTFGPDPSPWYTPERLLKHLNYLQQTGLSYLTTRLGARSRSLRMRCLYGYGQLCQWLGLTPPDRLHFDLVVAENQHACDVYQPQPFTGKITLFRATDQVFYSRRYREAGLGWGRLAKGGVEIYDIPGAHMTMLQEPHVEVLAQQFQVCLANSPS
jgi:amino acid adenylation domain-containing protein